MARAVLDSGAVTYFAGGSSRARSLLAVLVIEGEWPPVVPSAVLVECLTGDGRRDSRTNRFLKTCDVETRLDAQTARKAARLRTAAGRGSAVDAIVVAQSGSGGTVITGDRRDIGALAAQAEDVRVRPV
jgi:hypothetical protein